VCSTRRFRIGILRGVDRRHELENKRRSLAMLTPQAPSGLSREDAIDLIQEVQAAEERLCQLKAELRRLADG
jgi:hypothetical protein